MEKINLAKLIGSLRKLENNKLISLINDLKILINLT
jgi:hypothetical protein